MDNDLVCAYLWQCIIRLAFSPASIKDKKNWLRQYGQSLKLFWQVGDYPKVPSSRGGYLSATVDCPFHLGMCFEYAIEEKTHDKFTVRFMYSPPLSERALMWVHDVDGQYFKYPNQVLLSTHAQSGQAIQQMSDRDIEKVIDALIIHPTPHQHIESPIDDHDIRMGGGLLNPFLYLFHLRVQFCPNQGMRDAEKQRLIALFSSAIKNKCDVGIDKLMRVPEVY